MSLHVMCIAGHVLHPCEDDFPNDPICQKNGVNGCGGDRPTASPPVPDEVGNTEVDEVGSRPTR